MDECVAAEKICDAAEKICVAAEKICDAAEKICVARGNCMFCRIRQAQIGRDKPYCLMCEAYGIPENPTNFYSKKCEDCSGYHATSTQEHVRILYDEANKNGSAAYDAFYPDRATTSAAIATATTAEPTNSSAFNPTS